VDRPHVLIVGAGGLFGSRLARLLAAKQAYRLSLGGRNEANIAALRTELEAIDPRGGYLFVPIDRNAPAAAKVRDADVVVDCAGPFQSSGAALIEAAIAAGVHYVDLADARQFVAGIERFDAAAKAAGVAVISGASTTPALSHAVVAALTVGWTGIDSIDVAVVPGNRTPKGRSVIAAILSWVGKPVRVFREGRWQRARGWTGLHWVSVEGVGRRRSSLAEVPDLDAMPAGFGPRVRASFTAGMELGLLHGLIWLSGLAVRLGLVKSATTFAGLGHWVAMRLDRFGTDAGGMLVEVAGADASGEGKVARWSLAATHSDGPYVPVVAAAAMVAALTSGRETFRGARSAAGLLSLDQLRPWFEGLRIATHTTAFRREVPLYRRVMQAAFDHMPAVTRRLHRGRPAIVAAGEAEVTGAANAAGRLVARMFGFPGAGLLPVEVVIEAREGREYWTRFFEGRPMRSVMSRSADGLIEERFGAVSVRMTLVGRDDGLDMLPVGWRVGPVPMPRVLMPRITAEERVDAEGRHAFDVAIGLPVIGRLVRYRGRLKVEDVAPPSSGLRPPSPI
jgi:hypothetical protein